jgi:iron uptake system component EfeO
MRKLLLAGVGATALLFGAAEAGATPSPLELAEPIAQYKLYVIDEVGVLLKETTAFADAIKAGDLAKAKELYGPSRVSYERIEPLAELFSDLDGAIDSRADDH